MYLFFCYFKEIRFLFYKSKEKKSTYALIGQISCHSFRKQKKMPERLCLGCNVSKDKRELIRVVKTKTGEIFLDKTGKANGRGAYICNDAACLEKAIKTKRISRSLAVEIPAEVYDALRQAIQNDEQ